MKIPKSKVVSIFFPLVLIVNTFYTFTNSIFRLPGVPFITDILVAYLFIFSLVNGYGFRKKNKFTLLRRANFSLLLACMLQAFILFLTKDVVDFSHPTTFLAPFRLVWVYAQLPIYGYISFRLVEEGGQQRMLKTIFWISVYLTIESYWPSFMPTHDAFIGGLNVIIALSLYYKLVYKKNTQQNKIIMSLGLAIAIFLPFYSYLRGSSIILVTVFAFAFWSSKKKSTQNTKVLFALIFISLLISVTFWGKINNVYSNNNRFGYDNPFLLFNSVSADAPNVQGRFDFWASILPVLKTSPITGTSFNFTFFQFGHYTSKSHMLHNYFASAFVDGGLILVLPMLILSIFTIRQMIINSYSNRFESFYYAGLAFIIIATLASNVVGHQPKDGRISGIILMSALTMLVNNNYTLDSNTNKILKEKTSK